MSNANDRQQQLLSLIKMCIRDRPLPLRRPGAKNRKICCTRVPAAPGGRAEKAPARRARTASGLFAGALLTNRQIMRK